MWDCRGGNCISLFFFDQVLRLTSCWAVGAGRLWGGDHFAQLAAPHTRSLLSWFTQRALASASSILHRLDIFGALIGNLFSPFFLVDFTYQKAEADRNGNGIVKLDHSLSKQASWPTTSPWSLRLPPCHSGQELCLVGHEGSPAIKAQMKLQKHWGHFYKWAFPGKCPSTWWWHKS